MDLGLKPLRLATTRTAMKVYLNAVLLVAASVVLLGLAAAAYVMFYLNFIPQARVEKPVHLQFGDGPNPYGIVSLGASITSQQTYDIILQLNLPRSPPNLQAGNFMLDIIMLSPVSGPTAAFGGVVNARELIPKDAILFSSRRPAILTYQSNLVSLSKEIVGLPGYVLGLYRNAETLDIIMAEEIAFPKGWKNIPNRVYLELQGVGQDIQVYDVKLKLRATFRGLKWFMYNHRIFSFFVGTTAFWITEVSFAVITWNFLSSKFGTGETMDKERLKEENNAITNVKLKKDSDEADPVKDEKHEGGGETDGVNVSDMLQAFQTYGEQAPRTYSPKLKEENDGDLDFDALQPPATEVEDEPENPMGSTSFAGKSDSGKATSYDNMVRLRRQNVQGDE